jgi:hypothetical protein
MTIDSTPEGTLPSETPSNVPPPVRRRGVALPLLMGMVLGAGAAAGGYVLNDRIGRATEQNGAAANAAVQRLDQRLAAEATERQRLGADLAAVKAELSKVAERITSVEGGRANAAELAAVQDQLRTLADRMTAPPPAATPDVPGNARAEAVGTEVAEMRAALAALQSRPVADPAVVTGAATAANDARAQADALGRQVAALQARLQQMEAREREPDPAAARAGAVVAATQLRERLARPGPFATELDAFRAAVGALDDPALVNAIRQIEPLAQQGAPSLEVLRRRFDRDAVAALAVTGDDPQTWTDAVLRSLRGLVRVRRTGEQQPDTDAGRIANAEQLLALGDVAGAVAAVQSLGPPARAALSGWVSDAEARVAADAAGDTIAARVVALVTAQP